MRKTILILCSGLLLFPIQQIHAAPCNIDVSINQGGARVIFNPFSPGSTDIFLEIGHNGRDYNSLQVSFDKPLTGNPSSNLNNYPTYIIKHGGSTVFNSANNTASFTLLASGDSLSTGGRLSYTLTVTPATQADGDTALSSLNGSVTVPLLISDGTDGCSGTHNLEIDVSIPTERVIALSNDFSGGTSTETLGGDTLSGDETYTKTSTLYLWSNTQYKISVSSENGGVMKRDGTGVSSNAINELPYTLNFTTQGTPLSLNQDNTPNEVLESSPQNATAVEGKQVGITLTTQDTGKRAGTYKDTVTVKIIAFP